MEKRYFIKPNFSYAPTFSQMFNHVEQKSKQDINEIVESETKQKKWIVHGARAINKQLPPEYQRKTKDWDLFSRNPKQSSIYLEQKIEKAIGVDAFEQSQIPLTGSDEIVYRVVSKTTGEEVADFMKTPNHKNLYKVINGVRYETLAHAKQTYQKILDDPIYMHRWSKTQRDLNAIESFERKLDRQKEIRATDIPSPFVMISFKPMWG